MSPQGNAARAHSVPVIAPMTGIPPISQGAERIASDARGRDVSIRQELAAMRMRGSRRLSRTTLWPNPTRQTAPVLITSPASGATERALPTELGAPAVISGSVGKEDGQ